jgi:NitT/TauT family transport system permease protein
VGGAEVETVPEPTLMAGEVSMRRHMLQLVLAVLESIFWPFITFAGLLAIWQVVVELTTRNLLLIPPPRLVWDAAIKNWHLLLNAFGITLWESVAGFLIAIGSGVLLAIAIVAFSPVAKVLWPGLTVLNAAPKIVVAPIIIIWFGLGFSSKMALAALLSFFPIVISCVRGLSDVDRELLEFWHLMRATRRRIFLQVRLPNCLPYLYDGCLIALPIAIVGAVIAEFVASEDGVGHVIIVAYSEFDTPTVFAATIGISLLSTILFLLLRASEPLVIRWSPSRRSRQVGL